METFAYPKDNFLFKGESKSFGVFTKLLPEVLFIVLKENPREVRYTIQEDKVISLILVIALEWLIAVNPHKLDLNIMILSINIGVRVVCDIMLQFPEVYIAPNKV
ncbi:hypothetical protein SMI01S_04320 [Sphingobacterium mizutaii NBRC 14946 = DSM 11724]|jgi:hypothetical protein|uniref:Uncharacterized protein n=2 Tax=Sphingobacterium TaxID=28453 RepID=A0ABQ0W0E0_9SPHI|nr:hypothetical protein SMI01S_04320 [Sphingobacterium mizutaii NBRC 14946 = DSM 11724]GGE12568.1 hypothetical protein GCM10011516_07920 [Sphingobacterium soli]